jgi:Na+/H+-dicarboxylate symporter
MKKIPLYSQILIGMALGVLWGVLSNNLGWSSFTSDWIQPWGKIFINALKLIAIPLVIVSLIDGVSNLKDLKQLSSMGGKTIALFLSTTFIAIIIGLILVNSFKPGLAISSEKRMELSEKFGVNAATKIEAAAQLQQSGPLQPLVDIVPVNLFGALQDNTNMIQVIFFALLFGISMVLLPHQKVKPLKDVFNSLNEVMLKLVDVIMLIAPLGVFALIASINADMSLIFALGKYMAVVILGLCIMIFLVYPGMIKLFTKTSPLHFYKSILPAQTLAFSTSSSAATLPVTIDCCEKNLKLSEETTGFVLPLGATVNMDGTSLYQAVAAVFIAQVYGIDLSLTAQMTIVFTAILASIGAAPVPGAGMVMLVVILQSVGLKAEGLAMILAVDRILDMCRTVVNVTSDATVALIIDSKNK